MQPNLIPVVMASETLAIIPARSGSKGVLNKNLQLVGGIPLVARTVKAALSSNSVSRTIVTTDSNQIASVAAAYGAEIVRRPAELSCDNASSESALLHALGELSKDGYFPDLIVFLQCTSPFTTCDQIDLVVSKLNPPVVNSSFSSIPWHGFIWSACGDGINHDPNSIRVRRQDLPPAFLETGAIYAFDAQTFLKTGNRFCLPTIPVAIECVGLEVDTEADLLLCEAYTMISGEI